MTAVAVRARRAAAIDRWRPILAWWAISRLVTIAAFGVLQLVGPTGYFGEQFYNKPLGTLSSWDGVWYARVASSGYLLVPGRQSDPAFFPLYPILLRAWHALGVSPDVSGPIISNAALAIALVAFYELGTRVVRRDIARRAAVLAAITPMAFVYSMSYPTSLLFALVAVALLAAYEDRWLVATLCAAAAALARPEALVLSIVLASIAWSRRTRLDPAQRGLALAAVAAAPAALATYPLYLQWALGDARAWWQAERHWGRSFSLDGPLQTAVHLPHALVLHPGLAEDVVLLAVYAALLVVAARQGTAWPWIAAGTFVIVLPLFSGSVESEGRFGLLALPVYWSLARLASSAVRERALYAVSLAFLVAGVLGLPYIWP